MTLNALKVFVCLFGFALISGCHVITTTGPIHYMTPTPTPSPTRPVSAAVTLQVSPGWDLYPSLTSGSVIYQLSGNTLTLTYQLIGAQPSQSYVVGFDIFNLPDPGVASFGLPRVNRGTYTREGVTAVVDIFPDYSEAFSTDANGNGSATFALDLSGVASGAYNLQFYWANSGLQTFYRTGTTFGSGFGNITVP